MSRTPDSRAVLAALRTAFGTDEVLAGDASPRHLKDWSTASGGVPLAILRPRSTDELSRMLAICHAHGQAVVPQGGLSGLVGGAVPVGGEVLVSLERMNAIEDIDLDSGTVTVQAGAILQTVQEACRDAGALLAVDLGARGSCQVGGNVSTNAGGNRVIRYGNTRDSVLGLEVVLADGTVLPMMNRMVKNNAGMDLKHLFIGSEGVLGIVSRVVLKLQPLPQGTSTALVAVADFGCALRFLRHAQQSLSGQVSAFEIMWRDYLDTAIAANRLRKPFATDYPVYVLTDMHCGQPETDAQRFEAMLEAAIEAGWILDAAVAQSVADAEALWAIRDGVAEVLREYAPTLNFDVSVPVAKIGECAARVRAKLERDWPQLKALFFGHVGDGNLHVVVCKVPEDAASVHAIEDAVYSVVRDEGGSISAEHGIGLLKRDWLHYSRSAAELALMRTLKQSLDPRGILNPGKML
ncbi:FAD-binding oxidoreductase [Thauera sp. JM12B12]|uniref:FAD-binding oxidoreductase n=1 Tax=Thauera sp. JM12B12 TaxID=3142262 RepID=UPI0031F3F01D